MDNQDAESGSSLRRDDDVEMERGQFSLRDLFWCVTLISVGLGCLGLVFSVRIASTCPICAIVAFVGGLAALGAGLFAPFRRKRLGVLIGLLPVFVPLAFLLWYLIWLVLP